VPSRARMFFAQSFGRFFGTRVMERFAPYVALFALAYARYAEREARNEAVRTLEDVTQRVHGEYVKHLASLEQALAVARNTPSGGGTFTPERMIALETENAKAKEDARRANRRAEAVEQQFADDRVVGDLCGAKAGEAVRRQSDEQAAPVGRVGASLDQVDLREPVDRSRNPARAQVAPLAQLPDRERGARRGDERDQYSVGVNAKAVTGKQCPVQRSKDGGVDPQHAAPGAELAGRQRARLGRAVEVERTPGFDPRTT